MKHLIISLLAISLGFTALQAQQPKVHQTALSKEDSLGIKSGADPKKAIPSHPGFTRKKGRPVIFTVGDSTMKNGRDNGSNKQWGWGHFFGDYFDTTKVSVENHALGGRSSRSFITEGLWNKVLSAVRPGDYVLIQFGHNDGGPLNTGRARASLHGNGDNDTTVVMEATGKPETVHSFGWYMRKYASDVKAKGATPILLSHIPRNMFTTKDSTYLIRNTDTYGAWTKGAAAMEHVPYLDANKLIADRLEKMGKNTIEKMYYGDHTHTSLLGAKLNASTIAEGLKTLKNCDIKKYLKK
jgi:lysophospholipase L1-like esterase